MLTLTMDSIKDYQVCSLYYKYKYIDEIPIPIYARELLLERFENTLKRVASFFFYKKQAGVAPSYNAIINRWEKLWFPKDMDTYDLAVERHESLHGNLASFSNDAALALIKFHEDFVEDDADPLLLDENFLIPLGKDIRLSGCFDLILRDAKTKEYSVIKWSGRKRKPNDASLMLDFAALRLAFEHRNDHEKKARYYLYDLASAKPVLREYNVGTDDVNALLYWAQRIHHDDVHVPRRGLTAYCRGCPFDEPCAEWSEWPGFYKDFAHQQIGIA